MSRVLEIGMLALVAGEAPGLYFLGRGFGGIEDLRDVTATLNVRLARPVAAFASNPGLAMCFSQLGVGV